MRRILLALLLLLAAPSLAAAQYTPDSAIVIRSFDTKLSVQPSGTLDVTETIRFAFTGRWRGVLRDLSLSHRTAQGRRRHLEVEVVGITDAAGRALRWQEDEAPSSWERRLRIWIPGARNTERTVVIRYRVANAIRFYFAGDVDPRRWQWCPWPGCPRGVDTPHPDFDELYWNATGNAWDMPIERARARIVLPAGRLPLRLAAYTGPAGSPGRDAEVAVDSARGIITFTARSGLGPREGMTVAAGWPAGGVAGRPAEADVRREQAVRLWPLLLPLLTLVFAVRTWNKRGRDPARRPVTVAYEPPAGLTPAEAGTLIDHKAEMRDVVSTLVDLAVRGFVGIEEREEKKLLGLIRGTDYVIHRRRPPDAWSRLLRHEERFLEALFAGASSAQPRWETVRAAYAEARQAREEGREVDGDAIADRLDHGGGSGVSVRMSELRNQFYESLPEIRTAIYEKLIARGYYRTRPDEANGWGGCGGLLVIFGGVGTAMVVGAGVEWVSPWVLMASVVATAVILGVFGAVMPARTEAGARALEAVLGFREFLSRVESDRYRRMITSPEMFERYLPYAMAFGVEDRWAAAFEDLYREPPEWYGGSGLTDFHASSFTSRMSSMSDTAGSTLSSSPGSSDSGSGSGGGGSSGGGSGGGGGSGF